MRRREPGTGLLAQYFNDAGSGIYFTALVLTRTDPTVDFDWASSAPDPAVQADNFSVRWSGQIMAPVTGNYTFTTTSDDGVRLYVNGQLLDRQLDRPCGGAEQRRRDARRRSEVRHSDGLLRSRQARDGAGCPGRTRGRPFKSYRSGCCTPRLRSINLPPSMQVRTRRSRCPAPHRSTASHATMVCRAQA